jgi:hypothetical protein
MVEEVSPNLLPNVLMEAAGDFRYWLEKQRSFEKYTLSEA